jgi:hypothetical protein
MTADYNEREDDVAVRRLPIRLVAAVLLVIMLCTILSTPISVLYRSLAARPVEPLPAVENRPGTVNRIAYITLEHQLETIAPDGSERRRLTDLNSRFQFPAWSPDGALVRRAGRRRRFDSRLA